MTETERLFECVALRGHCPDCDEPTLERTGSYVRCHQCHSAFFAADLMVTRVKMVEA